MHFRQANERKHARPRVPYSVGLGKGSLVQGLQEIQPVAERIRYVEAAIAREVLIELDFVSGRLEAVCQCIEVLHLHRRMRLPRRSKVLLHSKVELHGSRAEPCTAAGGERGWLREFVQSQDVGIETTRDLLHSARHRELNVIKRNESHRCRTVYR